MDGWIDEQIEKQRRIVERKLGSTGPGALEFDVLVFCRLVHIWTLTDSDVAEMPI